MEFVLPWIAHNRDAVWAVTSTANAVPSEQLHYHFHLGMSLCSMESHCFDATAQIFIGFVQLT